MLPDPVPDQEKEDEVTDHGHARGLPPDQDHTEGRGGRGLKQ